MPSVIKIKRSTTAGAPSSLAAGELAYSFADPINVQGGSRLFIGDGNNITVIGGKYFTDLLDHLPGTLTASSAIITNSDNKIDQLNVDNINLNGNTVTTTNSNGNLILSANGTGLVNFYGSYTLPRGDGGSGYVLTTNGSGSVTWQPSSSNLRIGDDASTTFDIDLLSQTLYFYGGEGIDTALIDGDTVRISAEDASYTNKGIASFDTTNFTVTSGNVVTKNITLGTSTLTNGQTTTAVAGLTELQVDNIKLDGSTISAEDSVNADADLILMPQGLGTIYADDVDLLKVDTNIFYVSTSAGDNTYDGRRVNSAFKTLKYALSQASSGETIFLMPGTYEEVFPLTVPAGVTVKGSGLRTTSIKPTSGTNTLDCFLLNNASTIEDLTVRDMFYNTGNDTGYAFRFASNMTISERSPYVQRVTVLNKGSTTSSSDPYGFAAGDAGRGALLDGADVTRSSLEAAILFNECTFIVPNSRGIILTNGARTEWLNCFTYFADLAIEGVQGTTGWGGDGKTLITFAGVSGTGFQVGETIRVSSTDDSTVIDLVVDSVNGDTVAIDGKVTSLQGTDLTPASILGLNSNTSAVSIIRINLSQFSAEMRSISSANIYGNRGAKADGDGVTIQLMAHNFAYIGSGADLSNNRASVVQADEVIEVNSGLIYYNSVDQEGNFRVGDLFTVNFETGDVTLENANFDVNSLTGITFTDGNNQTIVNPYLIETGNLRLAGNTLSSTTGPINIDPAGVNLINLNSPVVINDTLTVGTYTFPADDGNAGDVLTTDGSGNLTWEPSSSTLTIADDSAATTDIDLLTETLTIAGGEGIDTTVSNNTITISGEDASDTNKGIASFNADDFDVASGDVSLEDTVVKSITTDTQGSDAVPSTHNFSILGGEGIDVTHSGSVITVAGEDASDTNKGVASFSSSNFTVTNGDVVAKDITLGTSTLTLGSTTLSLSGLVELSVDNLLIDGNEISSIDTDGNISLNPDGVGNVNVNNARIINLSDPIDPQDAATKSYVDAARSGLDVKQSVRVATTQNISLSGQQTIDGVQVTTGDRVLAKNQTDPVDNGIYVVNNLGAWSRSDDFDSPTDSSMQPAEVQPGAFFFVEEGIDNADSGWVVSSDGVLIVDTDPIEFAKFSGAGQIIAGDGLSKDNNILYVNVANGIRISNDNVELSPEVAGDGLTYTNGVLDIVGTTDRITVNANSIDIASTYVGQSSIVTVGTITTGTWNGDVVATTYGGTGKSSYNSYDLLVGNTVTGLNVLALGQAGKVLKVNDAGSALEYGDIDGGVYA